MINLKRNLALLTSALGLWLGTASSARATIMSVNGYPSAMQDTNDPSKVDAVLLVEARSSTSLFATLTVAGGFELTCEDSAMNDVHPSRSLPFPGHFASDVVGD